MTDDRIMPLYDSGSQGSLVEAFGIGFIIPFEHVSGFFPDSKETLKNICRNSITLAFFKTTPGTSSTLEALFAFKCRTA